LLIYLIIKFDNNIPNNFHSSIMILVIFIGIGHSSIAIFKLNKIEQMD